MLVACHYCITANHYYKSTLVIGVFIYLFIFTLFTLTESSISTSHIRFDSEESEEETTEEQQDVQSMKDITDDLNSAQSSSSMAASKQNHQARSEKNVSELKVIENVWDYFMVNNYCFFFCSDLGWHNNYYTQVFI